MKRMDMPQIMQLDTFWEIIRCVDHSKHFHISHVVKSQIKYQLLDTLRDKMAEPNVLQNSKLKLTFCARGIEPPKASAELLPILVDACPENFSTVDYFIVSPNFTIFFHRKSQQKIS